MTDDINPIIRSLQGCDFDPEPEQHYGFPWLLLFAGLAAIGVGYAIWRVVG